MSVLVAQNLVAELRGDNGPVRVLDGVSFEVATGCVTDIVGPSGSGKTTLLRVLARLLPGVTGQLILDGDPAERLSPQLWRTRVALQPQKPTLVPGCVRDNLLLPWTLKARQGAVAPTDSALAEAIESVELDVALDRDVARLSVGQQARVALLRVILTQPSVLLLDEPDASLDESSADAVSVMTAAFANRGGAVVRVRHRAPDGVAGCRFSLVGGHLTAEAVPS